MPDTVSIIGAGAGALCWAAHLVDLGYSVHIGTHTSEALKDIAATNTITMIDDTGAREVKISGCGAPIDVARRSKVVILCVPADRLPFYKKLLNGVLEAGQLLILAPGGIGGALYFSRDEGFLPKFDLVELNTLPFIARKKNSTTVQRMATLMEVYWASLPSNRGPKLEEVLRELIPIGTRVPSVLQTSLTNFNPVIHPIAMIMNAGRIESQGAFYWYREGSTTAIGKGMEAIDVERLSLQKILGLPQISFVEFFDRAGYAPGTDHTGGIAGTLSNSKPNLNIVGPESLNHRFIAEDVPYGLVPLDALSKVCGVMTNTIGSVIHLCEIATGESYRNSGFNAERLGIKGLSIEQLQNAVAKGIG